MDEQEARRRFAEAVRAAREQRGWTQDQLAEVSGVSRPTIQRYENAKTNPNAAQCRMLFTALSLDVRLIPVLLGFVTADEMGVPDSPPRVFPPAVEEVIRLVSEAPPAVVEEWVHYLRWRSERSA